MEIPVYIDRDRVERVYGRAGRLAGYIRDRVLGESGSAAAENRKFVTDQFMSWDSEKLWGVLDDPTVRRAVSSRIDAQVAAAHANPLNLASNLTELTPAFRHYDMSAAIINGLRATGGSPEYDAALLGLSDERLYAIVGYAAMSSSQAALAEASSAVSRGGGTSLTLPDVLDAFYQAGLLQEYEESTHVLQALDTVIGQKGFLIMADPDTHRYTRTLVVGEDDLWPSMTPPSIILLDSVAEPGEAGVAERSLSGDELISEFYDGVELGLPPYVCASKVVTPEALGQIYRELHVKLMNDLYGY